MIAAYLLGIVGLGVRTWKKRKKKTSSSSEYFLAGSSLRWPVKGVVAAALLAALMSTVSIALKPVATPPKVRASS